MPKWLALCKGMDIFFIKKWRDLKEGQLVA
jgi:hypothetical protein